MAAAPAAGTGVGSADAVGSGEAGSGDTTTTTKGAAFAGGEDVGAAAALIVDRWEDFDRNQGAAQITVRTVRDRVYLFRRPEGTTVDRVTTTLQVGAIP